MALYNQGKCMFLDGSYDGTSDGASGTAVGEAPFSLLLDVILADLHTAAFSFDADDDSHADIVATSLGTGGSAVTNYPVRGQPLATKTISMIQGTDLARFDAANTVFTAVGNGTNETFTNVVVQREQDATATDANTLLLGRATVNSTLTNGGNITIVWASTGVLQIT